jgi:hypothetical protein
LILYRDIYIRIYVRIDNYGIFDCVLYEIVF